MSLPKVIIL